MNTNDLYLEYARVIQMCKGTELEYKTWRMAQWRNIPNGASKWECFTTHPDFGRFDPQTEVRFAVAVLEGKPVWIGDKVFIRNNKYPEVNWKLFDYWKNDIAILSKDWKWTPPKRTFTLNGVELPCPDPGLDVFVDDCFSIGIEINGYGESFAYASHDDAEKVFKYLKNLLTEARDKP